MRLERIPLAVYWAAVALWAALIFALSSQRHLPHPLGLSEAIQSNLGHFSVYFVLAALLALALRRSGLTWQRALVAAIALSTLYGVSDEWHQSFVPGRQPSAADLAVDLVGASVAAGLLAWVRSALGGWTTP